MVLMSNTKTNPETQRLSKKIHCHDTKYMVLGSNTVEEVTNFMMFMCEGVNFEECFFLIN
jgi:hypothetical protein